MDGVFIQDLIGASTFDVERLLFFSFSEVDGWSVYTRPNRGSTFDVEPLLFFHFRRWMDGCEQAFSGRILYHLGDSEVVD
jgi:hypothetical protein